MTAGSHAIFVERCAVLEGVKVDAIAKATSQRDFQLQSVAKQFEYQKYASECICEVRAAAGAPVRCAAARRWRGAGSEGPTAASPLPPPAHPLAELQEGAL